MFGTWPAHGELARENCTVEIIGNSAGDRHDAGNRRGHDETTAPEPQPGFQGECGACRREGRKDVSQIGRTIRCPCECHQDLAGSLMFHYQMSTTVAPSQIIRIKHQWFCVSRSAYLTSGSGSRAARSRQANTGAVVTPFLSSARARRTHSARTRGKETARSDSTSASPSG